jgi:hypothetical protein
MDPLTVEALQQHILDAYALVPRTQPGTIKLFNSYKCCTRVPRAANAAEKEQALAELARSAAYVLDQDNIALQTVGYQLTTRPSYDGELEVTAELYPLGQSPPQWTRF